MSDTAANWRFAEEFVAENDVILRARAQSLELGIDAVTPGTGAQLALIAAAGAATSIIELGTGVGVSGLWMLEGAPTATLTTIDAEPEHLSQARTVFTDAGLPSTRVRLIAGRALDVLPRMNEGAYDLVFIDADSTHVIDYVEHGLRLVRPGGTVVVAHALWRGRVADPAKRDDATAGYRALLKEIAGSDAVISALSPIGDGLLQLTTTRG
ncbi:MAG: hypothetical protein RI885_689 [Actinomycetota bacterium]